MSNFKKGSSFGKGSGSRYSDNYDDYDDYGYGYGYGGYGSYSKGGGYRSYKSWNWGTFGVGSLQEEDDNDLFIKSHPSYFTPTAEDIGWRLDRGENTQKNRTLIKEFARYFYHRMIDEKDYFLEKYSKPETLSEEDLNAFKLKESYYNDLWDKFIPGVTPLEQAISLYQALREEQKKKGETGDLSDETIESNMMRVEFHEEIYKDPILNELLDMQPQAAKHKLDILNRIALIENLGSQFKIEKEIEEKLAHNSRIVSKKIMRDYAQLYQVDLYQRLLPTFKSKLLTKDLIVTVPIDRTEHKQKIIILVDFSGSMSYPEKQAWVVAIMVDRLKYVIKEEAEIFFSYFVNDPRALSFHHVYDRASALAFWSKFSTRPNGGDTRIGDMINHINTEINIHKRLHNLSVDLSQDKPEILIINDGQDTVKTDKFVYKTNAITLVDGENDELKTLCVKNNGKYVYITDRGIKTYDRENTKV